MRGPKNSYPPPNAAWLKEHLSYAPDSGVFTWVKIGKGKARLGGAAGWKDDQGRVKIGVNGVTYFAHRLAWLYEHGIWPSFEIDHINGVKSDNRIDNLREATPSENHRNRGAQKNNTVGYKGVCFDKRSKRFVAGVKLHGKRHNLGIFNTAKEAYEAYCNAVNKLHGEFAKIK